MKTTKEFIEKAQGKVSDKFIVEVLRSDKTVIVKFLGLIDRGYEINEDTLAMAIKRQDRLYNDEIEFKRLNNELDISYFNYDEEYGEQYLSDEQYKFWQEVDTAIDKVENFKQQLEDEEHLEILRDYEDIAEWGDYITLAEIIEYGSVFN